MKQHKTGILIGFAIASLLVIAAVAVKGFLQKAPTLLKEKTEVLGESVKDDISEGISSTVNSLVQKTVNETKTVVSEKAVELEKQLLTTIEKEVSNLTAYQIQALKTQICTNWGVIPQQIPGASTTLIISPSP